MARHDVSKLTSVEAARGFAACLVVFYHLARHIAQDTGGLPFGSLTKFGHAGVDFFFVLSGFIILHVHWDDIGQPGRVQRYVLRRVTRIYPLYWVVLAVTSGILLVLHASFPGPAKLLRDVLLLPSGEPTIGVAWTLQHEMTFYVIFLVLILSRWFGLMLLGAWSGIILLACIAPGLVPAMLPSTLSSAFCAQFFMGMGAAIWLRRASPRRPRLILAIGILLFLLAGTFEDLDLLNGYAAPARLAYGFSATLALVGLIAAERAGQLRLPRAAMALGSGSYAIYLTHLLLIGVLWKLLGLVGFGPARLPAEAAFLLIALGSILGGLAVSRIVEQPLMRLIRARLISRPVPGAASAKPLCPTAPAQSASRPSAIAWSGVALAKTATRGWSVSRCERNLL